MRTKLFTGPLAVVIGLVASAFMAGPALATDPAPPSGYIEICKDAPGITPSATFAFTISVNDNATLQGVDKPILIQSGQCSKAFRVEPGVVTVTETEYVDDSGFSTDDWTTVSAIHTTAPGAPDAMLVSKDLGDRTAEVTVNAGDESQATVVHFTNDPVNGYFEICKDQVLQAGLDGQSYDFAWSGANGTGGVVSVKVGACSFPILAPKGHVDITETGTVYVDTTQDAAGHAGIWADRPYDLDGNYDVTAATATLKVHEAAAPGDFSKESIVHFRNNSSLLKICKVVPGWAGMEGLPYSFGVTAGGTAVGTYNVNAFVKRDADTVYGCVTVGTFRAGTSIGVVEAPQPGQKVDSIWLEPGNDTLVTTLDTPAKDYTGQTATFTMQSGENELFFKDVPVRDPHLKICKTGGPANGMLAFTVKGKQFWPAGTDESKAELVDATLPVTVPLDAHGAGCGEAGDWAYIGPVTVTETVPASFHVTSITTSPTDRLKSQTPATGTAVVYMGYGTTVVTYTNVDPPAGGGSASSSNPAAQVTATPTSQPNVVSPAPAKPTKAAVASHVVSVKIVTVHGKRYVSIKMASANKTARVHLRLIDRHGTVMKNAVRTVKANVTTRILNLPIAKSIVKVRAIPVS